MGGEKADLAAAVAAAVAPAVAAAVAAARETVFGSGLSIRLRMVSSLSLASKKPDVGCRKL